MKKFFYNCSIKTRITFLYTILALIIVTGISSYAVYFTTNILREQETYILNDSLDYLSQTVTAEIETVSDEFLNLFDDVNFMQLYLESNEPGKNKAEQIILDNDFLNYFLDIKVRNQNIIDVIYMLGEDTNVYSSEYNFKLSYENLKSKEYYKKSMKNKNRILFENNESDEDFQIVRSFYFTNNQGGGSAYPSIGYTSNEDADYSVLVFSLKKSYLKKLMATEAEKRKTSIIILDNEGKSVAFEGDLSWISEKEKESIFDNIETSRKGNFDGNYRVNRVGIHMKNIELTDWTVVYVYDLNILYSESMAIYRVIFLLGIISVFAVFFVAGFVSGTVTKPIRDLAESMEQTVENNMKVQITTKYNDEVGYLSGKYKELMEQIMLLLENVKLAEQQKHMEQLKALQAQINPHFLYNTLDMVYWLAKMEKQDKIANLIADLADFFRLSLNKGKDVTTVKKEIEHVKKYMDIQRTRMENRFDYEIKVKDDIGEINIPKLILQPFVENTLVHGFEEIDYTGHIEIFAESKNTNLLFTIKDNGRGISEATCEELNERHKTASQTEGSHGYAIENVWERLKLYFANRVSLKFTSEQGKGTCVEISFPFKQGGDKLDD